MRRPIIITAVLISLVSIASGQTANPNLGEYRGALSALLPERVGTYKNSYGRKDLPPDSPKPSNATDAYLAYYESDATKTRLFLEAYKFASTEQAGWGLEEVERRYAGAARDGGAPGFRLDEGAESEGGVVVGKRLVVHTRNRPNFKAKEELRSVLWTNGSVMFNLYCPCVANTDQEAQAIEKSVLDFERDFLYSSSANQGADDGDRPDLNNRFTLIVKVDEGGKVTLNNEEVGSVGTTYCLSGRLLELFNARREMLAYRVGMENRPDLSVDERIEKTVWVVAPPSLIPNGQVTSVVKAIKLAGASPIKMLTEGAYKYSLQSRAAARPDEGGGNYTGRTISGGVLNGKAVSLPYPAYPPIARAANAAGTVTVEVIVDGNGKVISAKAVSGHPLLQQAAVNAAYQATFSPTLLSGQPVRVQGTLIYKFPPK